MTHKSLSILFFLLCSVNMGAQQTYDLPLAKPVTTDTEKVTGEGARKNITGVVKPTIQVFLPAADKANGCAVILCPGGGVKPSRGVRMWSRWLPSSMNVALLPLV